MTKSRGLRKPFWERVTVTAAGCIEYTGPCRPDGYCDISKAYGRLFHRGMWLRAGHELPSLPQMLLHSCDNRRCGNVEHLRVGTHADNAEDAVSRGRWVGPTLEQRRRLVSADQRAEIVKRRTSGEYGLNLAIEYGISPQRICDIFKGRI